MVLPPPPPKWSNLSRFIFHFFVVIVVVVVESLNGPSIVRCSLEHAWTMATRNQGKEASQNGQITGTENVLLVSSRSSGSLVRPNSLT